MLKPLKLHLNGWLSYDKATVDLNVPGITQLKGKTGAGKSAIFEAIYYLLFGETLRKKSSVKDLANKVLDKGYEIWLEFENNNSWYKVKEVRDRTESGLWFWKGSDDDTGLKLGKTNPETRKLILKELGMSSTEFKSIAFLGQRQSQVLISGTAGERAKLIVELFGLESYDSALKACDSDLKEALTEQKTLTNRIQELENDLDSVQQSMKIDVPLDAIDPVQVQKLKEKKENIEVKLEKIREKEADIREIIGKYNALKESKEKYNKLNKQIVEFEKQLEGLPKSGATAKDIDSNINEYREKRAEIKAEINKINGGLKELNEIGDLCPIDKKECPEKRPETFRGQREDRLNATLNKQKKDIENVQDCLKTWKEEKEKKETYEDAEKELNNKRVLRSQCLVQDLPDIETEQVELKKCKDGQTVGEEKLDGVRKEINELVNKESLKKQQEEFKEKVKKTLDEKRRSIEETKKKLTDISEESEYLSASLNIFKRCKMYRIDLVLETLNDNLDKQLREIGSDYLARFESQKQASTKKRFLDSMNIMIYNGSVWLPAELVSGGQENIVSVAALIATFISSYQLSKKACNFLLLDEIFGPLDSETLSGIFERITAVAKELGTDNVKIISHRDLDKRLIDHVWEIERVDGISKVEIN